MRQDLTLFTSHILLIIYTRAREGHKRGAESMTYSLEKFFFRESVVLSAPVFFLLRRFANDTFPRSLPFPERD